MSSNAPVCLISGAGQGIGRALSAVAITSGSKVITMGCPELDLHAPTFQRDVDIRDADAVRRFFSESDEGTPCCDPPRVVSLTPTPR